MKSVYRFSLALAVCLLVLAPFAALGQTTGTIDGTVTDQSGAVLPGVSVELSGTKLQGGNRVVSTTADGRFRFLSLLPGPYTVSATLAGFGKVQKTANVSLDAVSTANFQLSLSASAEVVVTSEAPVIDTTTAESGLVIQQATAQKLPLGRNYSAVVAIQPGVNQDLSETQGRGLAFTIYGATSVENSYLVDGLNTTNVIKGFQGKALSQEFIEEVQVKSSGYEAEYGRAMGGVINVVTKSGGNEFHGDAFGYFNTDSLTASRKGVANLVDNPTNPDNQLNLGTDSSIVIDNTQADRQDYGADLGGYLMKDHVWFFGAYNRVTATQSQIPIVGGGLATSGQNLPFDSTANIYSGKLTVLLGQGTTLVGTVFGDPQQNVGNLRNFTSANPIIRQGIRDVGAVDYGGSITQLFGSSALVTGRYARHQDRFELQGLSNDYQIIDYTTNSNGVVSNGFGSVFGPTNNNKSTRDAFVLNGTVYAGNHEFKVGGDYEENTTFTTSYYTGNNRLRIRTCPVSGVLLCPEGTPGNIYYQHDFYTSSTLDPVGGYLPGGNIANPATNRFGAYLQDKWTVMPSLTVSLGLRYDQEDVKDYTGATVFKLTNEWQPRVGIAWDPSGDGTSKVSASYGIFYFALPTDLNVRAYGAQTTASTYNFSSDHNNLTQDPNAPRTQGIQGGSFSEPVEAGIKGIYQSEYTLGYDKAIDPTFAVGAKATFRYLGRTIEDRCDLDAGYPEANQNTCVIFNPGSSGIFGQGQFHGCTGPDYLEYSNPPESACGSPATYPPGEVPPGGIANSPVPAAKRQYLGIELVAKKQVGRNFWAQASYIWSQLKGNYDGAARQANGGQTDPGINADYDYAAFTNNAYGLLYLDRPNAFRIDAAYTFDFGLTAGMSGYLRSGTPQNTIGYFNSIYGSELFLVQRGYGGCAIPTNAEAACAADRLPTDYNISASLGYTFKFNPVQVSLFLQGFNLVNNQVAIDNQQDLTQAPPGDPTEFQPDYHKITVRTAPVSLRFGARISF